MSNPAARDTSDEDPRTSQRQPQLEVPDACEREQIELVEAPRDETEPHGYGFGV